MADSAFSGPPHPGPICDPILSPMGAGPLHVVVTANEVSHLHGTGPLVARLCRNWSNIVSIRSRNDWGGVQEFGDVQICLNPSAREQSQDPGQALSVLHGASVESILCVPFLSDELTAAIAVQKSSGARLCGYVMDDQNVLTQSIPDALMREFLERCTLRLATHPELRLAYERKYGLKFYLLPAIVPAGLIAKVTTAPVAQGRKGALVGSFWDQAWFDRLCQVLAECDCEIDWFGNNRSPWLEFDPSKLEAAGIQAHGVIPEDRLAVELRKYPFVLVPAAPLDGSEANPGIARLSLPGRILFTMATSHTPTLVVGGEDTCGSRFVRHFGVGESAVYDAEQLRGAMDRMGTATRQAAMRDRASRLAPALSDRDLTQWLSKSLEMGRPMDSRFEDFFEGYDIPETDPGAPSAAGA